MKQLLSGGKWYLRGTLPYIPFEGDTGRAPGAYYMTPRIEATVPGGIHLDLYKAGLIENPYVDQNSVKCEWTEHRWWYYETDLLIDREKGKKIFLHFEGLDYAAEVYINNQLAAKHENMFTPLRIDITKTATPQLNVKVLFKGVINELGQFGATSDTHTQKSRFGYGWDFATRLVNIGIWQDVWLEYVNDIELEEAYISTDCTEQGGLIETEFQFSGNSSEKVRIQVYQPDGMLAAEEIADFAPRVAKSFQISNPALWYPNGMGEHPLYRIRVTCGEVDKEYRTGIRRLRYQVNEDAPEDSLPYTVVINGKRVQLKGMNKVPMDHLYGNVDPAVYEWHIRALVNQNVNMVRVWGGGIIETELFYDLCDENGILVWQDFIQSSSGPECVPSKKPGFLEKLRDAAEYAVKVKRNHVSLLLWCGGNELTDEYAKPVTLEDENIAMLRKITAAGDPERLFLPSTPSGPVYRLEFDNPDNHDVHAPWDYLGVREQYERFNGLKLLLHSEVGIAAGPEDTSLFLSENNLRDEGWTTRRHHGEFWYSSYKRDIPIFGEFETADEYAVYGQWIQAEGLRYIVEAEQRMGKRCAGTQIWCTNEPWPTVDNTSLIDYFGMPKMAYYWTKDAFAECGASLKYNAIISDDTFRAELWATPGKTAETILVSWYTLNGEKLGQRQVNVSELPLSLTRDMTDTDGMFFVRVSCGGIHKDYFFSKNEETPFAPARRLGKAQLETKLEKVGLTGELTYFSATLENKGDKTALFVHPFDNSLGHVILADSAYFNLLPGEKRIVKLTVRKRLGLFFEPVSSEADITFRYLNG